MRPANGRSIAISPITPTRACSAKSWSRVVPKNRPTHRPSGTKGIDHDAAENSRGACRTSLCDLGLTSHSEGEFATKNDNFERLENQLRAQVPISTFFDAVGGVRFSSPSTGNRFDGVIGLHGLAPQFFEVDADLFVGEYPSARLDVDYEVLLTNRLIATPTIELNLPFTDDTKYGKAAFGPSLEVGLRLSYDVVDRLLSPYIGIHYERSFGGTANIKRSEGEDAGAVFFLVGAKMIF